MSRSSSLLSLSGAYQAWMVPPIAKDSAAPEPPHLYNMPFVHQAQSWPFLTAMPVVGFFVFLCNFTVATVHDQVYQECLRLSPTPAQTPVPPALLSASASALGIPLALGKTLPLPALGHAALPKAPGTGAAAQDGAWGRGGGAPGDLPLLPFPSLSTACASPCSSLPLAFPLHFNHFPPRPFLNPRPTRTPLVAGHHQQQQGQQGLKGQQGQGQVEALFGVSPEVIIPSGGEAEQTAKVYTFLFSLILPLGGPLSVSLSGFLLVRFGVLLAFTITAAVQSLFLLISLPGLLPVQFKILAFMMFSMNQTLMWGATSAYVAEVFGFRNFGQLMGLVRILGGLLTPIQYSLVGLVAGALGGDYTLLLLALLACSLALFLFPAALRAHLYSGFFLRPCMPENEPAEQDPVHAHLRAGNQN